MKKSKILAINTILVIIIILVFNFINSYSVKKQPPSQRWSKEVAVGNGIANDRPRIIVEDNRILIAYETSDSIVITSTELDGKVIDTKEYKINSDFYKDMMFVKDNNNQYYILYRYESMVKGKLQVICIDNTLNEVDRKELEGIVATAQIDSSNILISNNEGIQYINTEKESQVKIPAESVTMVTGTKNDSKVIIGYMENKNAIKMVEVSESTPSEIMNVATIGGTDKLTYDNLVSSCDKNNVCFIYDEYVKGDFNGCKYSNVDLANKEITDGMLSFEGNSLITDTIGISGDKSRFYGTIERNLGSKKTQKDIMEFSLENGKAVDTSMVSRLPELCIYPYKEGEYIVYLSYSNKGYNVNLASTKDEFKEINNGFKKSDLKGAANVTLENLMMSLAYIFVVGIQWIFPVAVIAGIVSFLDYKFNDKKRKIAFLLISVFTIALQILVILNFAYAGMMFASGLVSSRIFAYLGCIIVGAIIYGTAYHDFKDDLEGIFIGKFSIAMLLNSVAVCCLYVPLMM